MTAPSSLQGQLAVVTGSSRGIGRSVAHTLVGEGARVVVNGRHADAVERVVGELVAAGGDAVGCVGSVADFDLAGKLVAQARDTFGRLDVLINCAGIAEPEGSSILDLAPEAWHELVDSHLTATFHTCRHAAPLFVAQRSGAILNTSSHAYLGHYGGTGYPAGKGGINSLTFAIAAELREHGVRANAICPGARTRLSSGPAYEAKIRDLHARGIMNDLQRDASLAPDAPGFVGPLYAALAGQRAAAWTGRLFTAVGGYVGLHTGGSETLLAYRPTEQGPWPVPELAAALEQATPPS
ncbi:MAG: SDR family oxidoreductase [Myxococcota bacterium]